NTNKLGRVNLSGRGCGRTDAYPRLLFGPVSDGGGEYRLRALLRHPSEAELSSSSVRCSSVIGEQSRLHSLRTRISLRFQIIRKKFFAWASSGNIFSSARNSRECTHLRLPRSLTGCFKCSIS